MYSSLRLSKCLSFFVLPMLLVFSWQLRADDSVSRSDANDKEIAATWKLVDGITTRLMEEHISPPTRQQMVMSFCRGLYRSSESLPPAELSQIFSDCSTEEELRHAFERIWRENSAEDQINVNQRVFIAVNAMLRDCQPGLRFINAKDNLVQKQLAENQYVGIGIRLRRTDDGWPQITDPFYGGAAQKAGARPGDLIVAINGKSTKGQEFTKVIDDLRGAKGTDLMVSLRHVSEEDVRERKMIRDVVPISSVVGREQDQTNGIWDVSLASDPSIAHVRFNSIVGSTAAEMSEIGRQIEKKGFEGVILDFRGLNPEMEIHHAIMLIDSLVGRQKIGDLISAAGKTSIHTQPDYVMNEIPMAVLANANVPGPLFLLLSALENSGRAKLVGEPVSSDGMCKKPVELADELGALRGVSYAMANPVQQGDSPHSNGDLIDNGFEARRFTLIPSVQIQVGGEDPDILVEAAVKALKN